MSVLIGHTRYPPLEMFLKVNVCLNVVKENGRFRKVKGQKREIERRRVEWGKKREEKREGVG